MENQTLLNFAIDLYWQILYNEVEYFRKKVWASSKIFEKVLNKLPHDNEVEISIKVKTFNNSMFKPFKAAELGLFVCTSPSNNLYTNAKFGDIKLSKRGVSRLKAFNAVTNNDKIEYNYHTNNDVYTSIGTAFKYLSFDNTQFEGQSLFDVICEFLENSNLTDDTTIKDLAIEMRTSLGGSPIIRMIDIALSKYYKELEDELIIKFLDQGFEDKTNELLIIIRNVVEIMTKDYKVNTRTLSNQEVIDTILSEVNGEVVDL